MFSLRYNGRAVRAVGIGDDTGSSQAFAMTLAQVDPCDLANVQLVCNFQTAAGLTPDGKYGASTAKAAQAVSPGAPAGCHPRPSWWAGHGQSNCGGGIVTAKRSSKHEYTQSKAHPADSGTAADGPSAAPVATAQAAPAAPIEEPSPWFLKKSTLVLGGVGVAAFLAMGAVFSGGGGGGRRR